MQQLPSFEVLRNPDSITELLIVLEHTHTCAHTQTHTYTLTHTQTNTANTLACVQTHTNTQFKQESRWPITITPDRLCVCVCVCVCPS